MIPVVGQAGTDVRWYPSQPAMVEAMLDVAKLQPGDVLMDLGSGDGRVVIEAARRGVRAIGVETDTALVDLSRELITEEGLQRLAEIRHQNFFNADLSEATVITLFLDRPPISKMLRKLASLRPGARIVSNTFYLWEHSAESTIPNELHFHTARLWELP